MDLNTVTQSEELSAVGLLSLLVSLLVVVTATTWWVYTQRRGEEPLMPINQEEESVFKKPLPPSPQKTSCPTVTEGDMEEEDEDGEREEGGQGGEVEEEYTDLEVVN